MTTATAPRTINDIEKAETWQLDILRLRFLRSLPNSITLGKKPSKWQFLM